MKKILFVATLAALLPLLFACGKVDDNKPHFDEPRFVQYAGQLVPRGGSLTPSSRALTPAAAASPVITFLEFTESGLYVLGRQIDGAVKYISGTYSVSGDTYTLSGFGTASFSNAIAGLVQLTITPNGGASETLQADFKKAGSTDVAYRTWTIDKTRATIRGFHSPVSADFVGCNFDEMAKFLNDNGHKGDYLPSGSLKSISFTGVNTLVFVFSDNTVDLGECHISGDNVSFSWKGDTRLFEVENGKATIEYMDGKCVFTVDAALKGSTTSGSVTFVMSPLD